MAIVSISRLQHRRGVRADLPANLNEAELGWCLDTRQLFIGNGNTWTGNSEILTEWSDNGELISHVYTGYTGVAANTAVTGSPTIRTLNSILNDTLNVLDYGAVGNGTADDTAAIQQAISDEWARISLTPSAAQQSRNAIYLPAGTYLISSSLLLYPFITLYGDGPGKTTIKMTASGSNPVMRTADSLGQTAANIGLNGAVIPQNISVTGITLDGSLGSDAPVVLLQRCSKITLSGEAINGWSLDQGYGSSRYGVQIESLGTTVQTYDITLNQLSIIDCEYGIYAADPITKISVSQNYINNVLVGAFFGYSGDGNTDWIRVSDSNFESVWSVGLQADTAGSVTSINNSYDFSGNTAISWSGNCVVAQSVADTFGDADMALQVTNNNPGYNLIFNPQQSGLVNNTPVPWNISLASNQVNTSTGITYDITGLGNTFVAFIDYSLNLSTYRKVGRISIVSDGTTVDLSDASTELNLAASVIFSVTLASNIITLQYTSTGSGTGSMQYIQTYWKS